MNVIPTTYFCATRTELRTILADLGLESVVAVSPSAELTAAPTTLPKLVDVMQGKASFVIARQPSDIAFVTAASWWRKLLLSFQHPKPPLGPSLQHSRNAAMLMIPFVDESRRQITPGFVSSYPRESELYRILNAKLSESMQRREGFLVSQEISKLLDQGYTIWLG